MIEGYAPSPSSYEKLWHLMPYHVKKNAERYPVYDLGQPVRIHRCSRHLYPIALATPLLPLLESQHSSVPPTGIEPASSVMRVLGRNECQYGGIRTYVWYNIHMNTTSKNICLKCKAKTSNAKFCSRSCSSSYNNSVSPKRIAVKRFCACGESVVGRKTKCDDCNSNYVEWSNFTLNDLRSKRKYQRNSRVRTLARLVYISAGMPQKCLICGYSNHFEVAHIIDINQFAGTTLVTEVNRLDNLLGLCRNHHWEFDHGML